MSPAVGLFALDGGAALRIPVAGGVAELRLGWKAARSVARWLEEALRLSPPWRPELSCHDWTDDGLQVAEYGVGDPKGDGREAVDAVFVRFFGPDGQADVGEDVPSAVFAGDHHPDGRAPTALVRVLGRDGQGGLAGAVAELSQRWKDEGKGTPPEVFVGPLGVVLDDDLELHDHDVAWVAAVNDLHAAYMGFPRAGGAAGVVPVDTDVEGASGRQGQTDHFNLSVVSQSGDDAESAGAGKASADEAALGGGR